ncbi:Tethering factor for nuclear proteasome sts1, partial [Nowakowskiella sp. JEL0078]
MATGSTLGWVTPHPNPLQYTFGISSTETIQQTTQVEQSQGQSFQKNQAKSSELSGSKRNRPFDDSDSDSEMNAVVTPSPSTPVSPLRNIELGNTKRIRTLPVHPNSGTTTLQPVETTSLLKRLTALDKDNLLSIFSNILSVYPFLSSHVGALIPRPTLASAAAQLQQAEKRFTDIMPYSRSTHDTRTDYSFNRVRSNLYDLRSLIVQDLEMFVMPTSYPVHLAHEFPSNAFGYLNLATSLVHRLPVWNNPAHNAETRDGLYQVLSRAWRGAAVEIGRRMKEEGRIYSETVVGEWTRNLVYHCKTVKGQFGFKDAVKTFFEHLGSILGVQNQMLFWNSLGNNQEMGVQ